MDGNVKQYPKPRPDLPDLPVGERYVLPEEMASFGNSSLRPGMERMAAAGWFVTPTMEDPKFAAAIGKIAEGIYKRIEEDILAEYKAKL